MDHKESSQADDDGVGGEAVSSRSVLDADDADADVGASSLEEEIHVADEQCEGNIGNAAAAEAGKEGEEALGDAGDRPRVELCTAGAGDAPVPPQSYESLAVAGKDQRLEGWEGDGGNGRVEVCSGDEEAPVPPQFFLDESTESDLVAKKKAAAVGPGSASSGSTPSHASATNVDAGRREAGNVRPPPATAGPSGSVPGTALPQTRPAPGMPSPPAAATARPRPFVEFYEVEARRVDEVEDGGGAAAGRGRSEHSVYEATFVPNPTWWQRHQRAMFLLAGVLILLIAGAVIAIGIVVSRPDDSPSQGLDDPTPTLPSSLPTTAPPPVIPPPPLIEGISDIEYLGPFFETDCGDKCWPYVQVDGETAVVAPLLVKPRTGEPLKNVDWERQIHILHKTANGAFEAVQQIDADYQPGRIAIFEDTMAVGANQETQQTGAVYVYERNATGLWNRVQRIVAPDSAVDAEFGFQVDISGDVMAIGAYQDRDGKIGSVYVYRHEDNGWTLEQKLAPVDDKILNFGMAVAIEGNRIAVGDRAYGGTGNEKDDPGGLKKGAVWLYVYDPPTKNWTEVNGVMTSDQCANWFGISLAFTYDYGLLIGCPRDDMNAGAVYYYEPTDSGYEFRQRIVPLERRPGMMFGGEDQISVHGNAMVVGTDTKENGTAHVFLRTNGVWVESQIIEPPAQDKNRFGVRVAMSGSNILVSSGYNAFFYEVVEGPSTVPCVSSAALGAMFETDCDICDPFVAIDGDAAVITKNKEGLQILSGEGFASMALSDSVNHTFKGVAVSGDVVVAGSPDMNEKNGSASVYQKTSAGSWLQWATLAHDAMESRERFGGAVDVDGDLIIVGAHNYLTHKGSAYVFRRGGQWTPWTQEAKLLPTDPNLRGFGRAVSIFNNSIVIGDSGYSNSMGAVFVFEYDMSSESWRQLNNTITNNDCDGLFGSSLRLTENGGLLVGCSSEQSETGAVYFYTREENSEDFILQQKLQSQGRVPNDSFGGPDQIAVDGDLMIVGTDKETNGTVSVFAKTNGAWLEVGTIASPSESRRFGYKVALSGRRVLVSSVYNVYAYSVEDC